MPKLGALGRDQFTLVERSELGKELETTIQVEVQPAIKDDAILHFTPPTASSPLYLAALFWPCLISAP